MRILLLDSKFRETRFPYLNEKETDEKKSIEKCQSIWYENMR